MEKLVGVFVLEVVVSTGSITKGFKKFFCATLD